MHGLVEQRVVGRVDERHYFGDRVEVPVEEHFDKVEDDVEDDDAEADADLEALVVKESKSIRVAYIYQTVKTYHHVEPGFKTHSI